MKKNLDIGSFFWEQIFKKLYLEMKLVVVLFLLSTIIITAQEGTRRISGTVKTINNEPLPGVTVKVKETVAGTITDQAGN
jgi:hypothetical protein